MNWIKDKKWFKTLGLKVKKAFKRQPTGEQETEWRNCNQCKKISYLPDLIANSYICECSFHFDLPIYKRFESLFDSNYEIIEEANKKNIDPDPLSFEVSGRYKYLDKIKKYRKITNSFSALTCAYGKVSGLRAVILCFDPRFGAGRMGPVESENYLAGAEFACREKADLWIVIFQSSGIDVHTGIAGLSGMPKTILATKMVKEANIPTFAIAARAVAGGTFASAFFQHEFIIVESKSVENLLFSGLRVTSNILKSTDKIPETFGTGQGLKQSGQVDIVLESRLELKETISKIAKIILHKHELKSLDEEANQNREPTKEVTSAS